MKFNWHLNSSQIVVGKIRRLTFECLSQRMLREFGPQSDAAKTKGLAKGEKYQYLFFIATKQNCRRQGSKLLLAPMS